MKKILIILLFGLIITLSGCEDEQKNMVQLPELTGMNQQEAVNVMSGMGLNFTFDTIVNLNIEEGLFVTYNDSYKAGQLVDKDTLITVYFSIHENRLPDLTGKNMSQILSALNKLNIFVEIDYIETDTVEEGLFSHYGDYLFSGDKVPNGTEVTVYIAKQSTIDQRLFISKYLEGTNDNRAIELYNGNDFSIDLSTYFIDLYLDGSTTISTSIALSGTIESNQTFILSHSNAGESILNKAQQVSSDLIYNGDDALALSLKDHRILDVVGNIGWTLMFLNNKTLVRQANNLYNQKEFDINSWDTYYVDYDEILGSHPHQIPETFTYLESDLLIPYSEPRGMVKVSYVSSNDGDTSQFTPGFLNEDRVRYVGINTREMSSGDPLAYAARNYTDQALRNATEIYIQHDPSTGTSDTYSRNLGLVWVDGVLLNYLLVKNGYSHNLYNDLNYHFVYEGITLHQWFILAENHAKHYKLGIWANT